MGSLHLSFLSLRKKNLYFTTLCVIFGVLSCGLAIGKAASDTLFVDLTGANNLPYVFIINGLLLALFSVFYSRLERKVSRFTFLFWLIISLAAFLLILYFQLQYEYWWISYLFNAYYQIAFLLIQMHFWTCVNEVYDVREGKNIFPKVATIGVIGTIVGSILVWLLASRIDFKQLFLVWFACFIILAPVAFFLYRQANKDLPRRIRTRSKQQPDDHSLKKLWEIPLVRYLTWISLPMWFVAYSLDWLFLISIEEMFKNRPNEMISFLGLLGGVASIFSIIFQLSLGHFLISRLGAAFSYAIYSFTMSFGALLFTIRGYIPINSQTFWNIRNMIPMTLNFLDESVFDTVHTSSLNVIYGAIPPNMRAQARAFIAGIIETSVITFTGVILFFYNLSNLPLNILAVFTLAISLIWIFLATRIKKFYVQALIFNLNPDSLEQSSQSIKLIQNSKIDSQSKVTLLNSILEASDYLVQKGKSGELSKEEKLEQEEKVFLSLYYIQKLNNYDLLVELGNQLENIHGISFKMSLGILQAAKVKEILDPLIRIYQSESTERSMQALTVIAELNPVFIQNHSAELLNSPNQAIRSAGIIAQIGTDTNISGKSDAITALQEMIHSSDIHIREEALRIVTEKKNSSMAHFLLELASAAEGAFRLKCIKAMGSIKSSAIVRFLIQEMQYDSNRNLALDALRQDISPYLDILHNSFIALQDNLNKNHRIQQGLLSCFQEIEDYDCISSINDLLFRKKNLLHKDALSTLVFLLHKLSKNEQSLEFPSDLKENVRRQFNHQIENMEKVLGYMYSLDTFKNPKLQDFFTRALEYTFNFSMYMCLDAIEIISFPEYLGINSRTINTSNQRILSEALELLDGFSTESSILSNTIKRKLILENQSVNKSQELPSGALKPDLDINILMEDLGTLNIDLWFIISRLYVLGELKLNKFEAEIKAFLKFPDKLVVAAAILALEKLHIQDTEVLKKIEKEKREMNINIERILFLRSVSIFADIDPYDLQWISQIVVENNLKKNQYLFKENEVGDSFYIVQNGEIAIRKGSITLETIHSKDYFGELALFDQQTRSASAVATMPTTLLSIERAKFHRLLLSSPRIAVAMFYTTSHRLRETTRLLQEHK